MRKKLVLAPIMMAAVLSFTACASSGSTGRSSEDIKEVETGE